MFSLETGWPADCCEPRGGRLPRGASIPTPECVRTCVCACACVCMRVCVRRRCFCQRKDTCGCPCLQEEAGHGRRAAGTHVHLGGCGPGLLCGHLLARGPGWGRAAQGRRCSWRSRASPARALRPGHCLPVRTTQGRVPGPVLREKPDTTPHPGCSP